MGQYSYYPGCSLRSSCPAYDRSLRYVFAKLGLELDEIPDWNCCGATAYMSIKETVSFAISARNLAIAEKTGRDVVAPCSSCFTILNKTNRYLRGKPELKAVVDDALRSAGMSYNLSVRVRHPLDVLVNDVGTEMILMRVKRKLNGLRVAPYYGCQIVRPERGFDDREWPTSMDMLFAELGAEIAPFPYKVRCCGGMLMTTFEAVGLQLNQEILEAATKAKADCIVTTCPMCQINLEAYQGTINRKFDKSYRMPVLFFTQLLGTALGATPREMGYNQNLIPLPSPVKQLVEV